jgi:hypothetical protein
MLFTNKGKVIVFGRNAEGGLGLEHDISSHATPIVHPQSYLINNFVQRYVDSQYIKNDDIIKIKNNLQVDTIFASLSTFKLLGFGVSTHGELAQKPLTKNVVASTWNLSKAILRVGLNGVDACSGNITYINNLIGNYQPIIEAMQADRSIQPGLDAFEDWNVLKDASADLGPSSQVYVKNYINSGTTLGQGTTVGTDADMILLPIQTVWNQLLATKAVLESQASQAVVINNTNTTIAIIATITTILLAGAALIGTLVLSKKRRETIA